LAGIDKSWGVCTNKLFYLAVAPEMYETIFSNLSSSGLTRHCSPEEGWTRIIVEEPFGQDFETAQKLDLRLGKLFKEVQIYRIDHYLAKEMLQNILAFRFSNNLFEKNWSNDSIERIDIKLLEKIGAEQRGPFYDSIGALRDVGQNHLLQMLALVTMDLPPGFSAGAVRLARDEVLKTLKIPTRKEIREKTIRAQYEDYRKIQGVRPNSQTETYFKILAYLESSRWRGVPITMESGKRMGEARKEVTVTFKHPTSCLCIGEHHQNKVVFAIEPEERITIHFWSKKPGLDLTMEERRFEFLLRASGGKSQYVEEYEKLLLDCIVGDQTLFISTDEVRAMWRYIDPIVHAWKKNAVSLKVYRTDTARISKEAKFAEKKKLTGAKKELGLIGLGKMGLNMAERLKGLGWSVVGFDTDVEKRKISAERGITVAEDIQELKSFLSPRVVWLMVPAFAGARAGRPAVSPVDEVIFGKEGLVTFLKKGDVIIDGGNSFFEDSIKRAKKLIQWGIYFIDAGVSGGPEGAKKGVSLMIGGERKIYEKLQYLFQDLAVPGGYGYVGRAGAGHFVKMVHNGIEYGMMQALAEGFSIIKKSSFPLNLRDVAKIYNHGSVIESRLVGWLVKAFAEYGAELKGVSGSVGYTGEGEWTIKTAKKLKIPVPVITDAFKFRVRSKKSPSFSGRVLSALRNQFGGHSVR
jgi:glucose-6-phosphate 1-dehydrogenase/6-phosphogluconate dehydrogenase (decarboxylating)